MEEFWHLEKMNLHYKSCYDVNEKGCILWTGATYASGYGYKQVKWPSGVKCHERIHRMAYMIHHKKDYTQIPQYNGPDKLECSHLCGEKLCINVEHLNFETHAVNQQRIHCKTLGVCSQLHQPFCII